MVINNHGDYDDWEPTYILSIIYITELALKFSLQKFKEDRFLDREKALDYFILRILHFIYLPSGYFVLF